ncbi:MAG: T9SS type A sorting domain-containing protein, partial [Bacteroidota bacterium]
VGTLPIELLSFDGRLLQDQIELSWITASEKNNAHFDIQRSDNGQAWHTIGILAGAGNSDEALAYQFMDTNPAIGLNRYRLKQVDFDGSSSLSPVVELGFAFRLSQVVVYPNPSDGHFTILNNFDPSSEVELNILNPLGQILHKDRLSADDFGRLEVELRPILAPGPYLLRMKTQDGQNISTKILIQ